MNNVSLILFYYILVGGLFTVYFYLALKRYSQGVGITFFNLSIFYYFVFFYVPFFYVVTGYYLKSAEFSVDFYFMSLYYSIVLVVFGIFYNLLIKIKATAPLLNNNSGNEENISYYFIALLVLVKIVLAFVELTPLPRSAYCSKDVT
jgi:cytochrome c biogenesis factor